jgi:hypothetical protein
MNDNDIVLLKLTSGEEIIGTVVNESPDCIEIKDTVSIVYHPSGDGKMSAGFAPHMPYANGAITLFRTAIAVRANLNEDMLTEYKRIFGAIFVPRKPGIIV